MVAGIRINRPPAVRTWVVMAVGLTLLVVGDALGARRGVLLHGDRDPSAGDAAHLLGYVLPRRGTPPARARPAPRTTVPDASSPGS